VIFTEGYNMGLGSIYIGVSFPNDDDSNDDDCVNVSDWDVYFKPSRLTIQIVNYCTETCRFGSLLIKSASYY
jgi:hypothetical protein